jgi:hypothetical protein
VGRVDIDAGKDPVVRTLALVDDVVEHPYAVLSIFASTFQDIRPLAACQEEPINASSSGLSTRIGVVDRH